MLKERIIKRLNTPVSLHGEGPIWHYARGTAMWVDILSGTIIEYQIESSNYIVYACNHMVSAVFESFDNKNELIATVKDGVGIYNLETQKFTLKTALNIDWSNMRCNDGAVDSTGDLWMSTTHINHNESFGELYCITKNWSAIKVIPQVTISNGPCWSGDNTKMFHTDSVTRQIKAYKFSEKQKIQDQGEIVISISDQLGFPDGMAMDKQGTLWIAIWGGACVVGFDSTTGKQVDRISLPTPHVSSLAFVGEDLNKMLITTSQKDMDKESLEAYPWSGYSFIIDMEVPGLETYSCKI